MKVIKRFLRRKAARLGLWLIKSGSHLRKEDFIEITDQRIIDPRNKDCPIKVIFDIGANIGQSTLAYHRSFPTALIYSFEPFEENFLKLSSSTKGLPNVKCFQKALSNTSGKLKVFRDQFYESELNSLEPFKQSLLEKSGCASSEVISLLRGDELCRQEKIDFIDILKTDTEGHDISVLEGFSDMLDSKRVGTIIIECGFLDDTTHTPFESVYEFLRSRGMKLAGFYETSHEINGRCRYSNALFHQSLSRN